MRHVEYINTINPMCDMKSKIALNTTLIYVDLFDM